MLKMMAKMLTVVAMLTNSAAVFADQQGGRRYPRTGCNRELVRKIFNEENTVLMDAIRKFYQEQDRRHWTENKFCDWLKEHYDGNTTADYGCPTGRCEGVEPRTPEVERSIPDDVRQEIAHVARRRPRAEPPPEEEPAPRESSSGGGFMSNPFMGGLLGSALGGFLGAMLASRMNQQQSYFPQAPWGPGMNNMMMPGMMPGMPGMQPPGMLPFPGNNAPGMLPFPGQQFGATNPWAMPYQGGQGGLPYFAGGGMNYGGGYSAYNGGVYRGAAPGVLPLAPQSSYSVMGSIPQNHWSLINVGR